ncbi:MAG: spore coat associated protein CotJA [Ruminococcaceae bacterium]|nr:spore coat associated protein CotJA [Oscillospiraceae bacterium]
MTEHLHTAGGCECDWLPVLAFVPKQELGDVYEPECGFSRGTIFPPLDKPFMTGGCAR